jgi:hypothetical protein
MPDLSAFLIIDASSGTVLSANTCYLVADSVFSNDQWEQFETLSDSELSFLARQKGHKLEDITNPPD